MMNDSPVISFLIFVGVIAVLAVLAWLGLIDDELDDDDRDNFYD